MLNLPTVITCSIVASHGASSHWHGAGAWVRPCHIDKPERSSSGSRHAPRTSSHQAISAFIFLRNDQWQTSKHGCNMYSSLALTCRNLWRLATGGAAGSFFFHLICLCIKGGLLSIATQELLLALQSSPPGLVHGIATWHTSGG